MDLKFCVIYLCLTISVTICQNVDVKTSSGVVRGQTVHVFGQSIDQFVGIPFAEPPVGELRFAKPKPIVKPLPGVIDATKFKYSCWQNNNRDKNLTLSEDCLFLNIWTQSRKNSSTLKPVMFWIYGGGLTTGSAMLTIFNGSVLASHDVLLVAPNYRLGPFGFLYGNDSTAPANVGFYDQLLALKWVNENIHLFGGDKKQITIFGESAGSESTSAHVISPESKGLFRRAIMESGTVLFAKTDPTHSPDKALKLAKDTAKQFNCTDNKWLDCLRKVDAKTLTDKTGFTALQGTDFLPITITKAVETDKFNKDLDIIAGVTKTEGSLASNLKPNPTKKDFVDFVRAQTYRLNGMNVDKVTEYYLRNVTTSDSEAIKFKIWDFFGDIIMKCPTYLLAKTYAKKSGNKSNVYFYEWTHTKGSAESEKKNGVPHATDVGFVFGLDLLTPNTVSKENLKFTENVIKYWTDFAKYGTTNWPNMIDKSGKSEEVAVKILDPKEQVVYNHFEQCETFWKSYFI